MTTLNCGGEWLHDSLCPCQERTLATWGSFGRGRSILVSGRWGDAGDHAQRRKLPWLKPCLDHFGVVLPSYSDTYGAEAVLSLWTLVHLQWAKVDADSLEQWLFLLTCFPDGELGIRHECSLNHHECSLHGPECSLHHAAGALAVPAHLTSNLTHLQSLLSHTPGLPVLLQ